MGKAQPKKSVRTPPMRLCPDEFFENNPDWFEIETSILNFAESTFPFVFEIGVANLRSHLFQKFCREHPLDQVNAAVRAIVKAGRLSQFRAIVIKRLKLVGSILANARFLPNSLVVCPVVRRSCAELASFLNIGRHVIEDAGIQFNALVHDVESLGTRAYTEPQLISASDLALVRMSYEKLLSFHQTAPPDSIHDRALSIREFGIEMRISQKKSLKLYVDRMKKEIKGKPVRRGQKAKDGESSRKTEFKRADLEAAHARLKENGYHVIVDNS